MAKKVRIPEDRPESGKVYSLIAGPNTPAISNGNTWAESEVKEKTAAGEGQKLTP